MRKLILAALLPLALTGCAGLSLPNVPTSPGAGLSLPNVPTSPGAVASQTVLDEQGALGVELAYKAFRTALEVATDAGVLKGANATKAAALDNRAYAAVGAARAAYRAGNAASYGRAVTEARNAITAALAAIGSK